MLSIRDRLKNGPCLVQYYILVQEVDKKQVNSLIKYVKIMINTAQEMKTVRGLKCNEEETISSR